jgi:acetolactate synthase-1/2/3 large subunit
MLVLTSVGAAAATGGVAGPGGGPRAVDTALQEESRTTRAAWLARWMPKLSATETPINSYRVVWDLMHTVDLDRVIVTHESGSAREYTVPFWEARQLCSFLGWGKSTQLGYSLGLAMGVKLAAPDKQVINVTGDMAFSTVGLDIETAVRCHIPILTIVLNNSCMSRETLTSFSHLPLATVPC